MNHSTSTATNQGAPSASQVQTQLQKFNFSSMLDVECSLHHVKTLAGLLLKELDFDPDSGREARDAQDNMYTLLCAVRRELQGVVVGVDGVTARVQ